ncbi:HNH endonuclease [Propionicimonas paludicola]|uniref:HNH endonuclease n=1 Tax=Propionicimonas paludicola TaxID=185243 RepID=A0A2A9CQ74_9ACTN|nr:HNH endonuclease signature motif containing protein [Propionicimonas paludicola]PFG16235.1 HNH endonuclease [Propionicimonas paludicola]
MDESFTELTDGQLFAVIGAALDALTDDRLRLPSDAEQLAQLLDALRLDARLQAWQQQLAARIEATEAACREYCTSTTTWLTDAAQLTPREARRLVKAGQGLAQFQIVGAAAAAGAVLPSQAEAITSVLADLPREFDQATLVQGQEMMVGFAASHDAAALRRLTTHLVEVLAPDTADTLEAARLERQERAARARRYLEFFGDGHGNVHIRGSLPVADAEPFIRIIDAYAAADKRASLEARDPLAELVTPTMRRADALVTMVNRHCQEALAPTNGGDRPRIVIALSYDKLAKTAADNGLLTGHLIGSNEPVPASVLRRLLCDADVLPAVLGSPSEILDVGRTQRLVTTPIRAALELRDGGCVFPGCDKPPQDCHAHHITPWWAGGSTSLENLVLVCAHHHGIIEPGHDPTADRWQVRLRADGRAEIIPPRRADPTQRPRTHTRFLTPMRA